MYNQSGSIAGSGPTSNTMDLLRQMREDGLAMKRGAAGLLEIPQVSSSSRLPANQVRIFLTYFTEIIHW